MGIIYTVFIFLPPIMPPKIDTHSEKILEFLKEHRYDTYRLKDIAQYANLDHLQKVSHRILQLQKLGYLRKDYESDTYEVLDEPVSEIVYLPLYGSAMCGHKGASVIEERPQETLAVSTRMLNIADPDEYFLVKAQGSSMLPLIKEDDIVLIKQSQIPDVGQNLLVVHNDVVKIKKLMHYDNSYVLVSLNKDIANWELTPQDEVQIVWVVKTVVSAI